MPDFLHEIAGFGPGEVVLGGFDVGNVDATVIAQRPKLRDYILQMEENIADTLGVDREQINVKATTEEHLGFTGDSSSMACHAVCLLMRL